MSDEAMKRPGTKFVTSIRPPEQIVQMIEHKGDVYVATTSRIFRIEGNRIVHLKIEVINE